MNRLRGMVPGKAAAITFLTFVGCALVCGSVSKAEEALQVGRIIDSPTTYHMKTVTLRGKAQGFRVLRPACYYNRVQLCCGAYVFELRDETGAIQVGVPGLCGRRANEMPPQFNDGEELLVVAQIHAPGRYVDGDKPVAPFLGVETKTALAVAKTIKRLND